MSIATLENHIRCAYRPPFVGRESESARLREQLHDSSVRLITVTGPAGIGKTRLVRESVGDLDLPQPVWVDVGATADPKRLVLLVMQRLGLGEVEARSALPTLIRSLGDNRLLVVVDDVAHLLPLAAVSIGELLLRIPILTIVATCRVPLEISAEHILPLAPLETAPGPNSRESPSARVVLAAAREREKPAVDRSGVSGIVPQTVASLGGNPLALTIAGALLASGSGLPEGELTRPALESLRESGDTARTAVEWAYRALGQVEQWSFRGLALVGPQASVLTLPTPPVGHVTGVEDVVTALAASGLVDPQPGMPAGRFTVPRAVREYAQDLLGRDSHCSERTQAWASDLVEIAERLNGQLHGPQQMDGYLSFEWDVDNLRRALRWHLDHHHWQHAIGLAVEMAEFFWHRGYRAESADWLEECLHHARGVDDDVVMQGLVQAGRALAFIGNTKQAMRYLRQALAIARRRDSRAVAAMALTQIGFIEVMAGDGSGMDLIGEAMHILRSGTEIPAWRIAETQAFAGTADLAMGRCDRAAVALRTSRKSFMAAGDERSAAGSALLLAAANLCLGDRQQAVSLAREALETSRRLHDCFVLTHCIDVVLVLRSPDMLSEESAMLVGARDSLSPVCRSSTYFESLVPGISMGARRIAAQESNLASYRSAHVLEPNDISNRLRDLLSSAAGPQTSDTAYASAISLREATVIRLIAGGHSDAEIEQRLTISGRTLRRVNASLFSKLGATSRSHAVSLARTKGLIEP